MMEKSKKIAIQFWSNAVLYLGPIQGTSKKVKQPQVKFNLELGPSMIFEVVKVYYNGYKPKTAIQFCSYALLYLGPILGTSK